jgi:hypothetical protein
MFFAAFSFVKRFMQRVPVSDHDVDYNNGQHTALFNAVLSKTDPRNYESCRNAQLSSGKHTDIFIAGYNVRAAELDIPMWAHEVV